MEGFAGELSFMATSAGKAFLLLMEPHRLMFLGLGCIMGLVLGIVPGIGGLAGTAMLLPFTFAMDPYSRLRAAARPRRHHRDRRSDSGRAVRRAGRRRLGGDGARRLSDGQARRGRPRAQRRLHVVADGRRLRRRCCWRSRIPILRPVMLYLGSPELLAFAVLGISMVAVLSGNAPLRGVDRRLPRRHDRDDRLRSADRHAALDLRQPLSVGRPAADADAARHLRAAGTLRPADRARRHRGEGATKQTSTRASGRA